MTDDPLPLYVTVEGIDGAGTSSVVDRVTKRWETENPYRPHGGAAMKTSQPSRAWTGDVARAAFEEHEDAAELTRFYLFMADRAEIARRIEDSRGSIAVVISDRGPDSTRAYQGVTTDLSDEFIDRALATVPEPDLTLWLDADPAVAAERIAGQDAFESDGDLQRAAAKRYDALHDRFDRIVRIDADQSLGAVVREAEEIIGEHRVPGGRQ